MEQILLRKKLKLIFIILFDSEASLCPTQYLKDPPLHICLDISAVIMTKLLVFKLYFDTPL